MVGASREQQAAALAVVGASWLTVSTFLLRMPLRHWWFTRMTGALLVITTLSMLLQVSFGDDVSAVVAAVALLAGVWGIAVGYVLGWPSVPVWASNLAGGFGVLAGTVYLLVRRVGSFRDEQADAPA